MKKTNRFGTPSSVSPHPKKLPYGPIPFSYTFTFETDPNYSGDNWVMLTKDSGINSNGTANQSYNQTVDGVDGCIKWTYDSSLGGEVEDLILYAQRDGFVGFGYQWGKFSSFPENPSDYSTYTVSWKYYISRQAADEGDTAINHLSSQNGLILSSPFPPSNITYTPTINQWVNESLTFDTFPEMDAFPGLGIRLNTKTSGYLTTDGDFYAIKYITVTLTP